MAEISVGPSDIGPSRNKGRWLEEESCMTFRLPRRSSMLIVRIRSSKLVISEIVL